MAAETMRSAVSRPSLFQGSAAFLSAVEVFHGLYGAGHHVGRIYLVNDEDAVVSERP